MSCEPPGWEGLANKTWAQDWGQCVVGRARYLSYLLDKDILCLFVCLYTDHWIPSAIHLAAPFLSKQLRRLA